MVKKENKRVMVTLAPSSLEKLDYLSKIYDMSYSDIVKMCLVDFHIFHQDFKK